ncbi:hypothetical protein [Nocardiopsis protaetiae]|uniref:hypothetical protein n=1 Tax=Nocardiopsis protaetiae TaxID=3382270 RepID=UPI00387AF09B
MSAFALVVVLGTACSAPGEDTSSAEVPRALPSVLPSPSQRPQEERAVDAYLGMMRALVDASLDGADDHPDLERFADGQALQLTRDMLAGHNAVATGEPVLTPQATEVDLKQDPPRVVVEDCVDETDWVMEGYESTAAEERSTRLFVATVTEQDGEWKVGELWLGEINAC